MIYKGEGKENPVNIKVLDLLDMSKTFAQISSTNIWTTFKPKILSIENH